MLKDPADPSKGIHEDVTFPKPMDYDDVKKYYEDQWREVQLFYWNNLLPDTFFELMRAKRN
jgi:hypothetical protein